MSIFKYQWKKLRVVRCYTFCANNKEERIFEDLLEALSQLLLVHDFDVLVHVVLEVKSLVAVPTVVPAKSN